MLDEIKTRVVNDRQLVNSFIVTFIIGLVAHGFIFANAMYTHDSASYFIFKNFFYGIASGTTRLTPFSSIWYIFSAECRTTWLYGIIELICYSFASYLVSKALNIRSYIFAILISAIMIVTPTTIAANTYAVDIINPFTLLVSCISAYYFLSELRYSNIGALVALVFTAGSYGPFICVTFALVLIRSYREYIINDDLKIMIKRITFIIISCIGAVVIVAFFSIIVNQISGIGLQQRVVRNIVSSETVNDTTSNTCGDVSLYGQYLMAFINLLKKIGNNIWQTILFFLPKGISYRLGFELPANSFFVENYTLLFSFYLSILVMIIYVIKKSRKHFLIFLLISFLLIISMNVYGLVTSPHLLMRYAFISPWFLIICVADAYSCETNNELKTGIFKYMTYWLGVVTTISGIYLANEVYTKNEAIYKSGVLLANRVADHIESIDGYVPGETRVFITGNLRKYYAPVRTEFDFVRDVTGVGSPFWDTAITYYGPFQSYLDNQIGISICYAVNPPFNEIYGAEGYADILIDAGYEIDKEEFVSKYYETLEFPNYNNWFWIDDMLVFKLVNE